MTRTWHKRLTEAREDARLNKAELAREVGVSSATVNDWESGAIKNIEGPNLLALCDRLRIRPAWLLHEKQPKWKDSPEPADESPDVSAISAKDRAVLEMYKGLTKSQQRKFFRELSDTKRRNEEVLKDLGGG